MSAIQENNNFSSFNFLRGDNSVDMIPPALDNGEPNSTITVYQRTPDIAIDLSRKLGRGALRGQYFSVFFFRVNTLKYSVSNFHSSRLDINEWLLE